MITHIWINRNFHVPIPDGHFLVTLLSEDIAFTILETLCPFAFHDSNLGFSLPCQLLLLGSFCWLFIISQLLNFALSQCPFSRSLLFLSYSLSNFIQSMKALIIIFTFRTLKVRNLTYELQTPYPTTYLTSPFRCQMCTSYLTSKNKTLILNFHCNPDFSDISFLNKTSF